MGNSALKSHLETSQKTGVFQLTGKGLQEVRLTCQHSLKRHTDVIQYEHVNTGGSGESIECSKFSYSTLILKESVSQSTTTTTLCLSASVSTVT